MKELGTALAAAFGEIDHALKNSVNPHFKSNYANLEEVLNVVKKTYKKHGLAIVQFPGQFTVENGFGKVEIDNRIIHLSGEMMSVKSEMPVNADKHGKFTPHAVGSAITFGRRYAVAAIAGITQADDDGNAGSSGEVEEDDSSPIDELRQQVTEANTRTALAALQTLVSETGDAELVAYFKARYKEMKGK